MKLKTLIYITFCLLLLSSPSYAQLVFVDHASGKPVEGIFVEIKAVQDGKIQTAVTNEKGEISLPLIFPLEIKTSHLNYEHFQKVIQHPVRIELSPKVVQLEELVVTAQFEPQSAKNSVYKFRSIGVEQIQSQGAASLDQALRQELNINISQDLATGNAGISMQGLSGQNVKILMDGIPIVGRNGNGNNFDLNQINVQDIERIEIIEGPMAVNFGANALAGVINIITKKVDANDQSLNLVLQGESAGEEMGWNQGRQIANLNYRGKLTQDLFAGIGAGTNRFHGYQGISEGRERDWNPKYQSFANASLLYKKENFSLRYKLDYLHENIEALGKSNDNIQPSTGVNSPYAFDEFYLSDRWSHSAEWDGKISESLRFNHIFSFSDYQRHKNKYSVDLNSSEKVLTTAESDQDTSQFKATVVRGFLQKKFSPTLVAQLGYDVNLEQAAGGRIEDGEQKINDFALFATGEWLISKALKVRPGLRVSKNTKYDSPLLPSLNLKYDLNRTLSFRAAYGKGYRAPTLRELYFEFVDSNHQIFGNDDLKPEYSHHIDFSVDLSHTILSGTVTSSLGAFYNDINDQISLAQSPSDNTVTTYFNLLKYKTLGFTAEQSYAYKNVNFKIGMSYTGRYNRFSEQDTLAAQTFFYSPQINAQISYSPEFLEGVQFNLFHQYNGIRRNFVQQEDENGTTYTTAETEGYHLLDASVAKTFDVGLKLSIGAKNLLNVQNINSSAAVGGGAHSGGSSFPVSYGRSLFINLNYSLNFKNP